MNRGGFSWKRAVGVTRAKQQFSRATGIPLTRSGRQRKLGRMIGGGCVALPAGLLLIVLAVIVLAVFLHGCASTNAMVTVSLPGPTTATPGAGLSGAGAGAAETTVSPSSTGAETETTTAGSTSTAVNETTAATSRSTTTAAVELTTTTTAVEPTTTIAAEPADDPIVYITENGDKYHCDGCRYLKQSKIPVRLSEAKAMGKTPCKICKPPQ